jgi:hypothetical protein
MDTPARALAGEIKPFYLGDAIDIHVTTTDCAVSSRLHRNHFTRRVDLAELLTYLDNSRKRSAKLISKMTSIKMDILLSCDSPPATDLDLGGARDNVPREADCPALTTYIALCRCRRRSADGWHTHRRTYR